MKKYWNLLVNPFQRIAGVQALLWGVVGLVLSTLICNLSGYHYNGLLTFGPSPNEAWWSYLVEHLIVWMVPALLFYIGGLICSRSRIRPIDVLGTTLFAQLPLLVVNVIELFPPMQLLLGIASPEAIQTVMADPMFSMAMLLSLLVMPFIVLMLVWMFQALKVSCNLKGARLWCVYLVGVIVGDILCRTLISYLLW